MAEPQVRERRSPGWLALIPDDIAYIAPFAVFIVFTWLGSQWRDSLPWTYPLSYLVKTLATAALLVILWPKFTKIRWNYWWLGVLVGIIGVFQWVGMQLWLQNHFALFAPPVDAFDPTQMFHTPGTFWGFVSLRMVGAVLIVPVMEELFWRDWLWRQILAPSDFKLAAVGEFAWAPFLIVPLAFATVHGNWWLTAIVWAFLIALLLITTRSLGACIIAHAVTNLLLALYVLHTHAWAFW